MAAILVYLYTCLHYSKNFFLLINTPTSTIGSITWLLFFSHILGLVCCSFLVLDVFGGVRTPVAVVLYALFLGHLGMSLGKIARAISSFVSRSYNAAWRWEKKLRGLRNTFANKCSISMYLVDDTLVWVGDGKACMIVAYEPFQKKLPGIWLTSEKKDHNELVKRLEDTQYTQTEHYTMNPHVGF